MIPPRNLVHYMLDTKEDIQIMAKFSEAKKVLEKRLTLEES